MYVCRIPPSQGCGPWRVYSKQDDYYMYTVVTDAIDELDEAVQTVFSILTNWVLYICLLIVLWYVHVHNLHCV